jgi:hypothetical protein
MAKVKKVKRIKENLLVEQSVDFVVESSEMVSLTEGHDDDDKKGEQKFLKLTGVFQKGNAPNGNKRIYKTELLTRETNKFQSKINQGLAIGKVYHPGFFDQGGPAGVTDVSHRVSKLWMEGDIVRGELLIFETISGKEVNAINDGGGKIGISSRGWGTMKRFDSVKFNGKEYKDVWVVDDNYVLDTFDLVLTPSVKTAIMRPVKEEDQGENEDKSSKCDENVSEGGGKESMTIEELRSLHPELYNKIHDAAVKEGKVLGASDATAEAKKTNEEAISVKDKEIGDLKEANTTLTADNDKLKKENVDLKAENEKAKVEKLEAEIKAAATSAVEKSDFKAYYKAEDIEHIASISSTVEDVAKEIGARDKVYENAIATFKANEKIDTNSKGDDTSEDGSSDADKDKKVESYQNDQRALAFG